MTIYYIRFPTGVLISPLSQVDNFELDSITTVIHIKVYGLERKWRAFWINTDSSWDPVSKSSTSSLLNRPVFQSVHSSFETPVDRPLRTLPLPQYIEEPALKSHDSFPFNETYKVNSKNRRIRKGWNKPDCFSWAKSLHNRILSKKCHLKQDYAQISKIFGYFWRTRRIFSHIFILFRRLFYFLPVYGMPNRLLPRFSQRKN